MPLSPQITITPVDIVTKNFDISAVTFTSSTATYTATGHTFAIGDTVLVSDLTPDGYNGTFTVTAIATNTFTVANTTNAAVTDPVGNAFWVDPTEYEYADSTAAFITDNNDLNDPFVNPALVQAQQALADAATAYTAAKASLQPSADTIVNASNQMTAIASNGITVYSGSSPLSGARVVMNSAGLAGYDASNNATFSIVASTGAATFKGDIVTGSRILGGSLNINGNCIIDTSGLLTATGATITGKINASDGTIGGFNIGSTYISTNNGSGGYRISTDGRAVFGFLTADTASITSGLTLSTGTCTVSAGGNAFNNVGALGVASVTSVGAVVSNGDLSTPNHTTTGNAANGYVFATGGRVTRSTASSRRYKENIVDLRDVAELNPRKLLDFKVRAFSYKADYLKNDDRANILIPGLIAEEVDEIYPLCADYADGQVENINDRAILINLLALVQDQEKRIAALEGK